MVLPSALLPYQVCNSIQTALINHWLLSFFPPPLAVTFYSAVNVSVYAVFLDGSESDTGYYQFPVLATPPILPQNIWAQYSIPSGTTVTHPNATQVSK